MILLMGIAGSGKGTQGALLAEQPQYYLMSMGDVLRQNATPAQSQRMHAGELLDDNEIIAIVDEVLANVPTDKNPILDGFPRSIPQAEWLLQEVKKGRFEPPLALHLTASHAAVRARLLDRGRVDDKDEVIEARFNEYERSTAPLLQWLEQNGVVVHNIDAIRSVEAVRADIAELLPA